MKIMVMVMKIMTMRKRMMMKKKTIIRYNNTNSRGNMIKIMAIHTNTMSIMLINKILLIKLDSSLIKVQLKKVRFLCLKIKKIKK